MSVLTTAFNAEPFIAAAVRSVLAQRGVQVEHVVVDDGSEDRTVEVARGLDDPRVRIVEAGRVGRGRALNLALEAASHDFVAILDADDVAHPDRLAVEVRALAARADLAAVGSGQLLLKGDIEPAFEPIDDAPEVRDVGGELLYYNPLSHSSVLFRRAALERVGGYDERRRALFDWDLYIRLVSVGYQLAKLRSPLVGKRTHPRQYFEGRRMVRYALECLSLQWAALGRLRRTRLNAPLLFALFLYRLVPRVFRLGVRGAVGGRARRRSDEPDQTHADQSP